MLKFWAKNTEFLANKEENIKNIDIKINEIVTEILQEKNRNLSDYENFYEKYLQQIRSIEDYKEGYKQNIDRNLHKAIYDKADEFGGLYIRASQGEDTFKEYQERVIEWFDLWKQAILQEKLKEREDLFNIPTPVHPEPQKEEPGQLNLFTETIKPAEKITKEYIYVTDDMELREEINKRLKAEAYGIDTETTGLDPFTSKIRLIQIAVKDMPVLLIDMFKISDMRAIQELFNASSVMIFHNAKFDLKFLRKTGFTMDGFFFDTMLASYLIAGGLRREGERFSLKDVVKKYLNIELNKEEQLSDWSRELTTEQLLYSARDAAILLPLRSVLRDNLVKNKLAEVARLEFDCVNSVIDLELNGIFFDKVKAYEVKPILEEEVRQAESMARAELGDINLLSSQQLKPVLEKKTGLKLNSTDKEYLKAIGNPLFFTLIDYKEKHKFYNDNFIKLPEKIHPITGRIHSEYLQHGTGTGRFTNKEPNLQQIPRRKDIRSCFRPESGHKFIIADYSQIELRIGAELSKDPVMTDAYSQGQDLHTLTASFITGKPKEVISKQERQLAKAVNFGLLYGAGAGTFKNSAKSDYGIDLSMKEAETFRNKYFDLYKGVRKWHDRVNAKLEYKTFTLGGRYRTFDRANKFKITDRLNSPDQGTGADILKKALVLLRPRISGLAKLVHIVHDEIILEASEEKAEEVKKILEDTMKEAGQYYLKNIPVEVEGNICNSWAEK